MKATKKTNAVNKKHIDIRDWDEVLHEPFYAVRYLSRDPSKEIYYRGQPDAEFELVPGLARISHPTPATLENDLYHDFVTEADPYLERPLRDLEVLAFMQHYGLPTRLLDWTTNFIAALYFAVEGWWASNPKPKCCAVWSICPYELNEVMTGASTLQHLQSVDVPYRDVVYYNYLRESAFDAQGRKQLRSWEKRNRGFRGTFHKLPFALATLPYHRDSRMQFQDSAFTLHWNLSKPLNRVYPLCRKLEIPAHLMPLGRMFLRQSGITEATIYPGLEGISRKLKQWINYCPLNSPEQHQERGAEICEKFRPAKIHERYAPYRSKRFHIIAQRSQAMQKLHT